MRYVSDFHMYHILEDGPLSPCRVWFVLNRLGYPAIFFSLVEDAVDYPQGTGVYQPVVKDNGKVRDSQRSHKSYNDYPDVVNGVSNCQLG